ncbi:MAG: glycosyltransferase family 4 protein [Pirellulales bacterium]
MEAAPTRIVHLVPSWEHVGAVRRIGMLASHFEREVYEFRVVALSARGPDPRTIVRTPLHCTALAAGRRLRMTLAWRLRRLVKDWRADVVHAWDNGALRVASAARIGQRCIRVIETGFGELPPAIDVEQIRREAAVGLTRERIVAELGLPNRVRLLGVIGRLTRDKHVTELLWALDQIRCVRDDVYLLVIGDGEARPFFERYARLYEIVDHVRFVGWRSDVAAWIAAIDVYCSASAEPSWSLAMLEAMALGVPVVAGDTPAHRRVLTHGETGFLVDIRQRSELARWCLRMLEDAELAARMTETARRQVAERFPIGPFVEAHRRLYRGVV